MEVHIEAHIQQILSCILTQIVHCAYKMERCITIIVEKTVDLASECCKPLFDLRTLASLLPAHWALSNLWGVGEVHQNVFQLWIGTGLPGFFSGGGLSPLFSSPFIFSPPITSPSISGIFWISEVKGIFPPLPYYPLSCPVGLGPLNPTMESGTEPHLKLN